MRRHLALPVALLAVAALLAGCGDDDTDVGAGDDTTTTTTTTTEAPDTTDTTDTTEPTDTTAPPVDGELPGERIEIYPYEGGELAVVGVEADDTLNVRSGPGVDFDVVTDLDPLATGVVATGHNRQLDDSTWAEVEAGGVTGWVNVAYVAFLGVTDDVTTQIAPTPDDLPRAETLLELVDLVAGPRAEGETPDHVLDLVVVDGPTVGDLGEVVVDILGYRDDSGLGERLHIFATPDESGEGFTLRTVESTSLCRRGVSDEGLCL